MLSANVIATVESSTGSPVMLNLKDNGAGQYQGRFHGSSNPNHKGPLPTT